VLPPEKDVVPVTVEVYAPVANVPEVAARFPPMPMLPAGVAILPVFAISRFL
jgi:hypothetical protein